VENKKICLINPPRIISEKKIPDVYQPLGLCYIASVLEKNGFEVVIIDAPLEGLENLMDFDESRKYMGLSYDELSKKIEKISPDIVGITVPFSTQIDSAHRVALTVKSVDRDIIVIMGGHHPTIRPTECLSRGSIDFVVIGEGEYTTLELIQKLRRCKKSVDKCEFKDIKGIAYIESGKTIITDRRPLIKDLDSLPFPARHLLDMGGYFEVSKHYFSSRRLSKYWTTMITSRGCPYNCVFCSVDQMMGRTWRGRSPENVVDEIEHLVNEYDIEEIAFEDDSMTLDRKRMEHICNLIIARGLKIEWYTPNGIRADTLDGVLLIKMKESGCKGIIVAPESGNQRVVNEIIGKKLDLKKVEEVVRICKKIGIKVGCFFMIGLVGETKKDFKDTLNFSIKLRNIGAYCGISPSIAFPLYETRLYKQAKEGGYLKLPDGKDFETVQLNYEPIIETPEFNSDDIYEICRLWRDSYIKHLIKHPTRILEKIPIILKNLKLRKSRSYDFLDNIGKIKRKK